MAAEMIKLGNTKPLLVSRQGFGCMGLTSFYGDDAIPEEQALEVLQAAYDGGIRHFDTAQLYQRKRKDGTISYNEELVGKFLKTLPKEDKNVTVATKFFPRTDASGKLIWSRELFMEETEKSLKRLGVDCIDLYYMHRIYPENIVSIEECMECMNELVANGKVKCVGLSEASADTIRRAHAVCPLTTIQQEWSLFARDLEEDLVPTCKALGIGIVSYSPVARGMLAGMVKSKNDVPNDFRANVPYLSSDNVQSNIDLIAEIHEMAERKNCSLSQLCIAWVMNQGACPIPGTTKVSHVKENIGANKVKLSDKDVQILGNYGKRVKGARGNEQYMKMTFQSNV